MAWRFNNPVTLTLNREEAEAVYDALMFHTEETYKDEPDHPSHTVVERMLEQVERKSSKTGAA